MFESIREQTESQLLELTFLQLLCEGHNRQMQTFLRDQGSPGSINVLNQVIDYIKEVADAANVSMEDAYIQDASFVSDFTARCTVQTYASKSQRVVGWYLLKETEISLMVQQLRLLKQARDARSVRAPSVQLTQLCTPRAVTYGASSCLSPLDAHRLLTRSLSWSKGRTKSTSSQWSMPTSLNGFSPSSSLRGTRSPRASKPPTPLQGRGCTCTTRRRSRVLFAPLAQMHEPFGDRNLRGSERRTRTVDRWRGDALSASTVPCREDPPGAGTRIGRGAAGHPHAAQAVHRAVPRQHGRRDHIPCARSVTTSRCVPRTPTAQ